MKDSMTDKKTILITGCSSGIGRECAQGLQRQGYRVFATVRDKKDSDSLQDQGLETLVLDLDDSSSINSAVDEILSRTNGTLYALFNNAAYGQPGAVEDLSRDVIRAQFETNLFGTMELTNRIIPVMRSQNHGRIIFNSSLLGYVALPYRGAYNASKFALEGLVDTLRLELTTSNITISLIEPGPITSRFRENGYQKYKENIDSKNSVHRKIYQALEKRLTNPGPVAPFTLPPDAVLEKLLHALESPKPKLRYPVTFPAYLFATLRRILTTRALDKVLLKISSGEHK